MGPSVDDPELKNIQAIGCLDLGFTEEPATSLTLRLNLESLAAAQLEAFANRPSYRLLLISGSSQQNSVLAADVPAISLVP